MRTTYTALAGLVAFALATGACADDRDVTTSPVQPTASTTKALVAPRRVLLNGGGNTAATGAAGGATTKIAATEASADAAMPIDSMIWNPWKSLRFELASRMDLPTTDTGWVYSGVVTPDLDQVAKLAAALGIVGTVENVPTDQGGGWRVGPGDGSGPSLWVSASGQLDWWYSPAWQTVSATETEVAPAPATEDNSGGGTSSDAGATADSTVVGGDAVVTDTIAPPANVPDEATAKAKATEFWAAAGIDVSGLSEEVYADEWQASVYYSSTDPTRPPVYASIAFGGDGVVQWASGTLGEPQAAGPFPLVDLDTALARLNDYYGFESTDVTPLLREGDGIAAADAGAETVTAESDASVSSDTIAVNPAPDTTVEAIDKVVSLVSVKAGSWSTWDEDGSVWYVPAYEFTDSEGGIWTIPAVTDEYLVVDQPVATPMAEATPSS